MSILASLLDQRYNPPEYATRPATLRTRSRMKLHPLLSDPKAILISHAPVHDPVDGDHYRRAAWQAMDALQVELEGEKAVIKPNLTVPQRTADPESGITTHPAFLRGVVEYLHAHGARPDQVYLLEDPYNSDDNEPRHWRGTGFLELADQTGLKLRTPKTYTCVKMAVPRPLAHPVLNVSRLAVAPDIVLFNVPKLKTHNLGITTLCLKNLMGAVNACDRHYCAQAWAEMPGEIRARDRVARHEWMDAATHEVWQAGLARRLADTAQVVRPALNLIEGVVAREGTGFQRGSNRPAGLAIAGVNMVAVDSVASYLMGFDPDRLIYLQVAARAGLGTHHLSKLHVYLVQDGEIAPCRDLDAVRIVPPLRVLSGIVGETQDTLI
jgi:uncharacterized protein (DUF362 family)